MADLLIGFIVCIRDVMLNNLNWFKSALQLWSNGAVYLTCSICVLLCEYIAGKLLLADDEAT